MTEAQEELAKPLGGYTVAELLAEVERRVPPVAREMYPEEMFNFLNVYRPAIVLELVVLREIPGHGTCVLLKDRLSTDVGYVGKSHSPGGFLLNEETIGEGLQRIAQRETGMENAVGRARLAGVMNNPTTERGHEVHLIFLVEMWPLDFPLDEHTRWALVVDLPPNLMASHGEIIHIAQELHEGQRQPGFTLEYSER